MEVTSMCVTRTAKRSVEEARASFRSTVKHLSDPKVQEDIEAEARQQAAVKRAELDELLARSQELGRDEIIR